MKIKLHAFLFIFAIVLLVGNVSASISLDGYTNLVISSESNVNITDIYNAIGEPYVTEVSDGVWRINTTILISHSTVYLNSSSGLSELRIDPRDDFNIRAYNDHADNRVYIDGVEFKQWNKTSDSLDGGALKAFVLAGGQIHNSIFNRTGAIACYNVQDGSIYDNITILNSDDFELYPSLNTTVDIDVMENITVNDVTLESSGFIAIYNARNSSFSYINHQNATSGTDAIMFYDCDYSTFDDIYLLNSTSAGMEWDGSDYNTGHNFTSISSQWSGFAPGGSHNYWENVTVNNAGHNGIDMHSVTYTTIKNFDVRDSESNGILITAGTATSPRSGDITLESGILHTKGLVSQENSSNVYIYNVTSAADVADTWHGGIIYPGMGINVPDSILINVTINPGIPADYLDKLSFGYFNDQVSENCTIIDSNVLEFVGTYDTRQHYLINTNFTDGSTVSQNVLYYPNIKIVDENGTPIEGVALSFEANNSLAPSRNALGQNISSVATTSTGKMDTSNINRSNCIALATTYYNDTYQEYYEWNVTATYNGSSNSTIITPSMLVYSPDSSDIQSDLITIILDIGEAPLSISSSSPSGSTISTYNTSTLTTSITVNKQANISVYLDAVLVQTNTSVTTATYVNDSMSIGTHNLTMLASVGGESVNRVWTVTVSDYVVPSEDTINLDLTVQQIITAIILGGLIPLVIVTVILFSNLNNIQIDNSKMVTVMIVIAVILVLTVVILNPLVEWV